MSYSLIRKKLICVLAMVLLSQTLNFVQAQEAQQQKHKAPLAKLDLKSGDSIVFLGDSITHQCLYTQYVEDYFYTRFPEMRLKFHNSGVGGAKAWDALARFDRDVAAYKPKYVTVLLGMNDGQYQPFNDMIFETYYKDMKELISKIEAIGAQPILMTPTMFDARAARLTKRKRNPAAIELYNSVLAYYGTWLREVAAESGFGFVDMYSPLNNITLAARQKDPTFTIIKDAVHPDPPGQVVMAYALLSDMNVQRQVSRINISKNAKGNLAATAKGGTLSDLKQTDVGVSFTWLSKSLPWVVPAEAEQGAKLTKLGHRMSQESLSIHDLPAGRYELSIDGEPVGQYTNIALARHIELQSNAKT
ncbi:MAG: SGNH/GDSL hydrolase family protein, partial [Planctomycetes bacterium]|nr:SGNH/GDSL hydrolase family protein [Planctomycetota bacterium]